MYRIDYQNKIIKILDEAVSKLSVEEFDKLLKRVSEDLEGYKG